MLTALVAACALLAGFAGSWSPCGFSMVETLAPRDERTGAPRPRALALAAFTLGALTGGALMLGGLSALGAAAGIHGGALVAAAAGVALLAAVADAVGLPVVPQVRRQVPESWRRRLPLTVAGGLYGVLLGLGTTTFVLAFAVYALMVLAFAHADPAVGVVAGLAFGAGRALPVLVLSNDAEEAGERLGERPGLLRALRAAAALPLAAAALALPGADARAAASVLAQAATDPSAAPDGTVAWHVPGGTGVLRAPDGSTRPLPATRRAAVGDGKLAVLGENGTITVTERATNALVASFPAPEADALAVSDTHVAWRDAAPRQDAIRVLPLAGGDARTLAVVRAPAALGRPSLDGSRVAYHVAGRHSSTLREADADTGASRALRRARSAQLLHPAILGDDLLYVRVTHRGQKLVLGRRYTRRGERTLHALGAPVRNDRNREPGGRTHPGRAPEPPRRTDPDRFLHTTALTAATAYVTRLRRHGDGSVSAALLAVAR